MRKSVKKSLRYTAMLLIASVTIMMSGCGSDSDRAGNNGKIDGYIAAISKGTDHEFWKTMRQGLMDAGEELNYKVTFEAPKDETDIDKQIELVQNAIDNNADAIVLAPLDTEKLNDVVSEAVDKGIMVITVDSDITSPKRTALVGTDNESAGAIAARHLAENIGGSGKVAVVSHVEGAQTAIARNQGFLDEIEANYKNIVVVDLVYSGGEEEVAYEQTKELISKYTDLKGIYATNEGAAIGVAKALSEHNLKDRIEVIGFDSSESENKLLLEGAIDGMIVQNPYNMGYLAVRNIVRAQRGEMIEKFINTGATYVTKDNFNDEDTQWLLYPLGKE